ncbi:Sip1-related alpha-galactosidase [Gracilibacillus alcaliphilus]|uniref:Sip1-related alpha-galactosidase n=1 Tax=Gracilibacillus alcaliphilus TaxID=1401441 RepID=UPI00195D15FE|nr:Sip1-related alpha-galactosidase [Gracilibacillus alcaliphilus]
MFSIAEKGERLELLNNQKSILDQIHFQVQVDALGTINLDLAEVSTEYKQDRFGEYQQMKYVYKQEEKIDFTFVVHCYASYVHAYVEAVVHNDRPQGYHDYLTSEKSIIIKVDQLVDMTNLVAHYRHKDWWTRPYFGHDLAALPDRTQSLLWECGHEFYQLLPVADSTFKTELTGAATGFQMELSSYDGGRTQAKSLAFVLAKGDNPFALSRNITKRVLELTGNGKAIADKRYPERLDYLGWCSWDAFYQEVNEDGIRNKVMELKDKDIPVKWLMIDDGWSQVNDQRLRSFEPDPAKFPNGFKSLTKELKETYDIDSIGVWHTLAGYWGGVDPGSPLALEMASHLLKTNSGRLVPYPDKAKGYGFWETWHHFLEQQGIDFVKVDGQSGINNFLREHMAIGEASVETHKAIEASVGIHFDHCIINCMGMAQENVYNRPISAVSRSSDDFVPDVQEYGFAEHALQNVYNSFYHGELYYGDWDMFWTIHRDAKRHALLRAISGGPIYTSDRVGQTDADLLRPLIYKDGRIIRCDQPGKPTADTLMVDPVNTLVPMKVWNKNNGAGVLAVFHIHHSNEMVTGTISPSDIEGMTASEYMVYDYFNQTSEIMKIEETKPISLNHEEYGLYIFIPKQSIIPIGLIEKYIPTDSYQILYRSEDRLVVQLREGGRFAFATESKPVNVLVNGEKAAVTQLGSDPSICVIDCPSTPSPLLIEISI